MNDIETINIITTTKKWLENCVIGLNLCPFAKAVYRKNQIRYSVASALDTEALHELLKNELLTLMNADPNQIDTTLLIHPHVLQDFLDFNDFLTVADQLVEDMNLTGVIQIASFHPQYQFEGTAVDDIENYTNRSPYPILHLLREERIHAAVQTFPDTARIYQENINTLRRLGYAGWQRVLNKDK